MIAVVLPAAIAALTSGQVRSSMYTDCALPECSGAAGVAANAATFKERAIAAGSKTRFITASLFVRRHRQQQRQSFVIQTVSANSARTDKCSGRSTGEQRAGDIPAH